MDYATTISYEKRAQERDKDFITAQLAEKLALSHGKGKGQQSPVPG